MFCGTRWVEDEKVASRALDIWDDVKKIVKHWESLPKYKRPSSKSYATLLEATKDPLFPSKLHFFSNIAKAVSPFLRMYQTTKPMMPFFYDDLHEVIRGLMEKFVASSVLNESKSATSLSKIDLTKKENLMKKPDVGFGAANEISNLLKKEAISHNCVKSFRKDCIVFLSSMITKLHERSPLKYAVVRNASSITPYMVVTHPERSKTYFKNFLERLVNDGRLMTNDADQAQTEFTKFHSTITYLRIDIYLRILINQQISWMNFISTQLDLKTF